LLAREVFGRQWAVPYALALAVLLWPGVVVRGITISNAALELPLATAYLLACWRATSRPSVRRLLIAAALLGLCLLTKATLIYLVPLLLLPGVVFLRARHDRWTLPVLATAAALPVAMLAPWFASNLDRYNSLTPTALAFKIEGPFLNPTGKDPGLTEALRGVSRFAEAMLPQEWWPEYGRIAFGLPLRIVPILLVVAALGGVLRRPALARSPQAILLGLPIALSVVALLTTLVLADWDSVLPRFLYPSAPALALFVAWAWRDREFAVMAAATAATAVALLAWTFMVGAYYFTDVGASLGITAAP
jgi:4-amino-4-deoxy-L-arabinose transferase-like glycosyltransferase